MTRSEWEQRYTAHVMKIAEFSEEDAKAVASAAADENLENNGDLWLDPEEDADVEMSYWTDDDN